ncbi:hypothetical protein ACQR3P_29035 [Rhodococcus sp. IEGM1300]
MSALTAKTQPFKETPYMFSDEHLIYHMIQSAVDVQPNGFFRYISKNASDRMHASRAAVDRKVEFYMAKGILTKVMLQDEGFKQGRARFFKFLDATLERMLFAFHGIEPEPIVLGPGETSDDFEMLKERLSGKSHEVKKSLELHLSNMPIQVQLLPESVELKIADMKRWPLTEASDLPGVEYLDIPNPRAYEARLLRIAEKAKAPAKYTKVLTDMLEQTRDQFPDKPEESDPKIIELKPTPKQVLKDENMDVYYPYSLRPPAPKEQQITMDQMATVHPFPNQGYYQPPGYYGNQPHPSWGQPVFQAPPAPPVQPEPDYRPASIRIEERAFDHLSQEDDTKVLALITESLSTNMKFLQDLSSMLSNQKLKEQMTALMDMKASTERENNAIKHENAMLRQQLKLVQDNLSEDKIRRAQLDAYAMFETFFNLTPQDMYQQRKQYAKKIEEILHHTFQDVLNLSRQIK